MNESITIVKPKKPSRKQIQKNFLDFASTTNPEKSSPRKQRSGASSVDHSSLLFEFLPYHPYKLLQAFFATVSRREILIDQLSNWRNLVAFDNTTGEQKDSKAFYDTLPSLINALYQIHEQRQKSRNKTKNQVTVVSTDPSTETNAKNPFLFLRNFFERFPLDYVRRELACSMHAVLNHAFDSPDISPDTVLDWYGEVYALTEAASILSLTPGKK